MNISPKKKKKYDSESLNLSESDSAFKTIYNPTYQDIVEDIFAFENNASFIGMRPHKVLPVVF